MKTPEQKLFELVDSIGEMLEGDLHIIDNTESYPVEGEKVYRVYHKDGYCWDIRKTAETEDEETGEILKYNYDYLEEWEGFKKASCVEQVITMIALAAEYGVDKRHNPNRWSK